MNDAGQKIAKHYPLRLPLRYMAGCDEVLRLGNGVSLDLSSKSILFSPDSGLLPGVRVEVSIRWPATRDGVPLRLLLYGPILWHDARGAMALIERHSLVPELKDNVTGATPEWNLILDRFRGKLQKLGRPVSTHHFPEA